MPKGFQITCMNCGSGEFLIRPTDEEMTAVEFICVDCRNVEEFEISSFTMLIVEATIKRKQERKREDKLTWDDSSLD